MFRIGEFSKIARVSGRLLRYYDEIDLFKPVRIESSSGYRYYSAVQLPQLNRILALRDLGMTLDQIADLTADELSVDEMRGMLTMKKAEIERSMSDELARIRGIEFRLQQIEREGRLPDQDLVLKPIPEHRLLSVRTQVNGFDEGFGIVGEIMEHVVGRLPIGHLIAVMHSEVFETEDLDIEVGFELEQAEEIQIPLSDGRILQSHRVEPVPEAVTYVAAGAFEYTYTAYNAIGAWMEANRFGFAGPTREMFLNLLDLQDPEAWVREIQIPVQSIGD